MLALSKAHLRISGHVQGVFYRHTTREKAAMLGLSGWVRNMPDGSVEAEAVGPKDGIEELIAWCWQGPPAARVTDVHVRWFDVGDEAAVVSRRFEIR